MCERCDRTFREDEQIADCIRKVAAFNWRECPEGMAEGLVGFLRYLQGHLSQRPGDWTDEMIDVIKGGIEERDA